MTLNIEFKVKIVILLYLGCVNSDNQAFASNCKTSNLRQIAFSSVTFFIKCKLLEVNANFQR